VLIEVLPALKGPSVGIAAIYFPSGDHRGEKSRWDALKG
jgi:hypothetical protein